MIKYITEFKNRLFLIILTVLSVFLVIYHYKTFVLLLIIVSNKKLSNEILDYFIFTSITDLFLIYIKLGVFLTSYIFYYIFIYHVICFLSPGLFKTEYNYLKFTFFVSIIFCIFSIFFFSVILIPSFSNFFLSFQQNNYLQNFSMFFEAKIVDYLIFYKETFLSCFVLFQVCVCLVLLTEYVFYNYNFLRNSRKIFYLLLLTFSTLITPPDVFSQIITFCCLIFYFEMIIFIHIYKLFFKI